MSRDVGSRAVDRIDNGDAGQHGGAGDPLYRRLGLVPREIAECHIEVKGYAVLTAQGHARRPAAASRRRRANWSSSPQCDTEVTLGRAQTARQIESIERLSGATNLELLACGCRVGVIARTKMHASRRLSHREIGWRRIDREACSSGLRCPIGFALANCNDREFTVR